ncbi:MAG: hypothetical protein DRN26_03740 [Thermoplasmata archaeon]|nr:MAG: hypothetical protein DRN26_03740 [Thermoplasmata archaeon]
MNISKGFKEDLENALACVENAIDAVEYKDLYEAYTSILEAMAFIAPHICENKALKDAFDYLYRAWREAYKSMDLEQVINTIVGNVMNAMGILRKTLGDAVEP